MASTNHSPVMVEQPTSPSAHPFASSDYALSILSPPNSSHHQPSSSSTASMPASEAAPIHTQELDTRQVQDEPIESRQPIEPVQPVQPVVTLENNHDGDDSSNSESNSDSSTSTETPGTISTPRSSAHDSGNPIPESGSTQLDGQGSDHPSSETNATIEAQPDSQSSDIPRVDDSQIVPPLPTDVDMPTADSIPSWVQYEEDTSSPDADELREIEKDKTELSAADTVAIEKDVFSDLDDPDLRPSKKIRLSWVIKGIRGTRERPNRARIMTSPAVCIDGNYWNIKFFPRGNKSRNSLAAYVRCSPVEPISNTDNLEGSFKAFECLPDVPFPESTVLLDLELKLPEIKEEEPSPPKVETQAEEKKEESQTEQPQDNHQDDDRSISGDEDDPPDSPIKIVTINDYRVSAQLGLVVYNPAEPRTCHTSSASHQFYPHQDDWGWDTAVNQWEDIHRRRPGERQALLRNDTLAVDAYIRIYDDHTKALFWHASPGENQWDAKGLAGVFPLGTRLLYHSPATAGISAWTLLAPFRSAIQRIDAGAWRRDSAMRPKPLIAYLQLMLFQMRHMKKEELYVHLDKVIQEITRSGESFDNVKTFWEAFRRAIETETEGDSETKQLLKNVFGTPEEIRALPLLSVQDVEDFQDSATRAFEKSKFAGNLPDFLPLTLNRQSFDSVTRQWRLHLDRVRISEEVDLSDFCTDKDGKYTLYGFIVHDGERTSGKFFSVLRPTGPGGKWLAFSDGNGNKVFSYTMKRVREYEGLAGSELKKAIAPTQTIHTALYIRTSRLSNYLSDQLEPYILPFWLKPHLDESYYHDSDFFAASDELDKETPVPVELFWDKAVSGQEGKLDLYRLKSNGKARQKEYRQQFTADLEATIGDVQDMIAATLEVDQKAFKLWAMNYHRLGGVSKGYMYVLPKEAIVKSCLNTSQHLTLWFTMMPENYELDEDALAKNFLRIEGAFIEAPSKPESLVHEEAKLATDSGQCITGQPSPKADQVGIDTGTTTTGEAVASPDEEQESVREAVQQQLNSQPNAAPEQAIHPPTGGDSHTATMDANDTTEETSAAAPDDEQAAVRAAVEQAVLASSHAPAEAPAVATEVVPSNNTSQGHQDLETTGNASSSTTVAEGLASSSSVPQTEFLPIETALEVLAVPSSETNPSVLPLERAVTPSESSLATAAPLNALDGLVEDIDGSLLFPVVHGHLFEASTHGDAPLSHGDPSTPVGIPVAVGNDQIVLIQPNQEDISPEDAALISSMIAADLEAEEGLRLQEGLAEAGDTGAESGGDEDVVIESRPLTPRPKVTDLYGFLHVFDAEQQRFTAHGAFLAARNSTINSMVRKHMGYDDVKKFQLWKRDGTYRTVGVSPESTFQDLSLEDCCEIIVGEQVGETRLEALKSEAKCTDPGQLMRYLAMVQRGHPITSVTTDEAVEIAEFGGDYYKGPLVRGQRHGKGCSIITLSGDTYEGPLLAGQKSGGKGKMTYQNGDEYEGDWLDDQKHGQGEFKEKRTGNRYVGGYENDKRWGKGITYWEQADEQAALCQVCYFEVVDALFYKCGHVVACYACAKLCAADSNGCPVCRKPIEAVVKMYRS